MVRKRLDGKVALVTGASRAELPVKAVGFVATSEDPMKFSGTFIDAVAFLRELGLAPA